MRTNIVLSPAGAALWMLRAERPSAIARRFAAVCAAAAALVGLLTLL